MRVNIKGLIDDAQCYDTVRELRRPEGRQRPFCDSRRAIKRGCDDKEPARRRYECKDCGKRFDDLTGTVFASRHQPFKVWIPCLSFMGLNLSSEQIARGAGPRHARKREASRPRNDPARRKSAASFTD